MSTRQLAPKREIFGWAMFDFANQAYTLLIITVVFGDLYTRLVVGDAPDYRLGNLLWSLALATSYLLVVIAAPLAGAIMDHTASKKRFLFASYILTVIATAALYFVAPGYAWLGFLLIVISNFAYSIGEAFIAAFLPELGPAKVLGKISGFGWALGYVGGMASAVFVLLFLGDVTAENFERIRWVGPWAGFFFLVAAIPTFLWLRDRARAQPLLPGQSYLSVGWERVRTTLSRVREHRDLVVLLISAFFSGGALYIIIAFAFIYGAQVIGWSEQIRTLMFVLMQITAAVGALGFGFIQDRIGALRMYMITLVLWSISILLIYFTPRITLWLRDAFDVGWEAQHVFVVVGCVAGLSLGSCQSAVRTLVGLFSPLHRTGEFFGFWGLAMRLSGIFGLVGVGLFQALVGLQNAILFCLVLFLIALVIAWGVDEPRGRRNAERESLQSAENAIE